MDKPNADFSHSITSIEDRLNSKICTLVLPVFSNNGQRTLESFVDVISRKYLIFERFSKENQKFVRNKGALKWIDVQKNTHYEEIFLSGMEDLVISLADVDKDFEKELVGMPTYAGIPLEKLTEVIRRNTLANKVHPLACGSALHSNASVCPLLDMVVDFLPSPEERKHPISPEADVCAFVFKVRHDKRRGQLNYVRIYRGKIQPSQPNRRTLVNANTGEHQTNFQLFAPFSDLLQPIDTIDEGNIAVITGLKNTKTGDTLVNCTHMKHKSSREGHVDFETLASSSKNIPIKNIGHLALEGIETPPPVFSCIIEPPNAASEIEFRRILAEFAVEDPSFRAKEDEDTGQIIIEGMGELHIEVVRERLLREHGMNAFFGPLQVNYKEVPQKSVECSERMEDVQNKKQWCSLRLRVEPMTDAKEGAMVESFKEVVIQLDSDSVELSEVDRAHRLLIQYPDYQKAINDGCLVAVHNGPLSGYPVANLRILLREFSCSNSKLHPTLLSACANKCLTRALKMADLQMREPIMRMEVLLLPNKLGEISNPDPIIRELLNRRATILDVSMDSEKGRNTIVRATIPLVETQGFSRTIRSLSSGMANFHLQPIGYFPVETEFVRTNI